MPMFVSMIPSAVTNSVLVKVDWEVKNKMKYGTLELEIRPLEGKFNDSYDPTGHRQTCGEVVSLPLGYDDHHVISRIHKNISVGDKIYFHYNSIDEDSRIEVDDEKYYYVPYDMIFCRINEKLSGSTIQMVGSHILCEPYFDPELKDIGYNGIKGKIRPSGIITDITGWNEDAKDGHNLFKATLVAIDEPLAGDPYLPVAPGDTVYFDKDSDFENWIEGKKYFVMKQMDLILKEI